jgi:hypothetical protein
MLDNTIYNLNNSFKPPEVKKSCKDPSYWGPKLWAFIHSGTRHYPENPSQWEKDAMVAWIKTLGVAIPCEKCKVHYAKNIKKVEGNLDDICASRSRLFRWICTIS